MADTNINIVIVAANCLEGLALGLRANFNKYRQSVAGLVMDRLKERKVTVVEALSGALNAMYSTVSEQRLGSSCNNLGVISHVVHYYGL